MQGRRLARSNYFLVWGVFVFPAFGVWELPSAPTPEWSNGLDQVGLAQIPGFVYAHNGALMDAANGSG